MDALDEKKVALRFLQAIWSMHNSFCRQRILPIPVNQFSVLITLKISPNLEPISQTRLGETLQVSKQQLSIILDRLMQRGYIERQIDAKDKRRTLVYLTKAGIEFIEEQDDEIRNYFIARFNRLSDKERRQLSQNLEELSVLFEKMDITC